MLARCSLLVVDARCGRSLRISGPVQLNAPKGRARRQLAASFHAHAVVRSSTLCAGDQFDLSSSCQYCEFAFLGVARTLSLPPWCFLHVTPVLECR